MKEPLFLQPVLQEKIWGGVRLKEFGFDLESDKIGECWSISAHKNGPAIIKNGAFAGENLAQVYKNQPQLFAGEKLKEFPLLTKILDANAWLSVQVHPDDNYAQKVEGEYGKTECWYIIDAKKDAEIIYGHTAETREELACEMEKGEWETLLTRQPVKKGDFFYVPAGTMHAIGPGVLVLETQQSSDVTYRVYDFDRPDEQGKLRDLHIDKALDVLTVPAKSFKNQGETELFRDGKITHLLKSEFFNVDKWDIRGDLHFIKDYPYTLVTVIEGSGQIQIDTDSYPLVKGDSFILTSDIDKWIISGELELIASGGNNSISLQSV